jgi:hypothetical protein
MTRIIVALVLLAHGIGHSIGPLALFKVSVFNPEWHGDSWLLTGPLGSSVTQVVGVGLWLASIVAFTLLAGVVMGWLPESWWAPLGIVGAVVSLAGVLLFPIAFPTFSTIGAIAVDLAVLAAVLWFHWAPADLAS